MPKASFFRSEDGFEADIVDQKSYTDKDTDLRLKGGIYAFYVVALNADDSPCTDCNFQLSKGSKTSAGLNIVSGGEVINGRAVLEGRAFRQIHRD